MTESKENGRKTFKLSNSNSQYSVNSSSRPPLQERLWSLISRDIGGLVTAPASDSDKEDICPDHPASLNVGGRGEK